MHFSRPGRWSCTVACTLAGSAAAFAQPSVIGRSSLEAFFQAASTSRVDVIMIGDSNQVHGGTGWDHGLIKAYHDRYSLYATGLMPIGENEGNGMGLGLTYSSFSALQVPQYQYTGAPTALNTLMDPALKMKPHSYVYLPDEVHVAWTSNTGMFLDTNCILDISANLRFHMMYGTFASGTAGSFRPAVRFQAPPYSQLAVTPKIETVTGVDAPAIVTLDLPASPRTMPLNFRFVPSGTPETQDIVGPFMGLYQRAENLDRLTGVSAHTFYAVAAQSARNMAESMITASDDQLTYYFGLVRSLQDGPKHILFRIFTGTNDMVENEPSIGPKQILPGNSAEAYYENMTELIKRLTQVWAKNGWPAEELFFSITISPPVSDPDSPLLISYRDQSEIIALEWPRIAVVRMDYLTSRAEINANQWGIPGDPNHMTQIGYESLSALEVDGLRYCAADIDESGTLDIDDFIAFQTLFALSSSATDMNDDGALDIDDFIDFQTRFAIGC